MKRRQVIAAVGSGIAVGMAGCSGGGNGDGSEEEEGFDLDIEVDEDAPARLELLGLQFPDQITYGDEFEAEIAIGNTGGEPIEEDATVELERLGTDVESTQSAEINASGLESGETRDHGIGPFTATAADDFRVEPGESFVAVQNDADDPISVEPQQASMGDRVESPDDLRITVTDVSYEQSLIYNVDTDDQTGMRKTLDDRVIAVPRITIENAAGEAVSIPEDFFSVEEGTKITGIEPEVIDGPDLRGTTVNPGDAVEGYIAAGVDIEALGDLDLGLAFIGGGPSDVLVDLGDDSDVPEFEIADQMLPTEFSDGDTEISFEITNTGDVTGYFRGYLEFKFTEDPGIFSSYNDEDWFSDFYDPAIEEIPPGGTRTVTFDTDYDSSIDLRYRFQPFETEWLVEVPE